MKKHRHFVAKVLFWIAMILSAAILLLTVSKSFTPNIADLYLSRSSSFELPALEGLSPDSLLNSGTARELDALPGIGAVLSARIIETRERDGLYYYPEDIMTVSGIGEKRFADIMHYIEAQQTTATDLLAPP